MLKNDLSKETVRVVRFDERPLSEEFLERERPGTLSAGFQFFIMPDAHDTRSPAPFAMR
jgi:hypothetical protein